MSSSSGYFLQGSNHGGDEGKKNLRRSQSSKIGVRKSPCTRGRVAASLLYCSIMTECLSSCFFVNYQMLCMHVDVNSLSQFHVRVAELKTTCRKDSSRNQYDLHYPSNIGNTLNHETA